MRLQPTIGLEVHAELLTKRKMFCDCLNDETQLTPNTNVCPVCTGQPGALPVPNKEAIEMVIKAGLALNCQINLQSKFDRKNYFYPDLPKAYQISQYDQPFCYDGYLTLPSSGKRIRIRRIHLEEDTASLEHAADGKHSLVDFNRAGVPLMELVTEPDFHSSEDVVEFGQEFQLVLRYLGVSDGDMEKGHLRLEANISVAPEDAGELGTKVEVKNINSFRFMKDAIDFEIARHSTLHEEGRADQIVQETRGWNEHKNETFSQRSKEEAHDYRYFPDPDIPPFVFSHDEIEVIRGQIAELPWQRRERLSSEYNLSAKQAELLVRDVGLNTFFEETVSELRALDEKAPVDLVYNYLTSDAKGIEKDLGVMLFESKLTPRALAGLVQLLAQDKISSRVAKDVLKKSYESGVLPEDIVEQEGLGQISDSSELEKMIEDIVSAHPGLVDEFKGGKESVLQFFVGQVMARTKGRANPALVKELIHKKIS